ncbi:MAG TPA: BMP family protein [Levilinea sp.]|nr:BMP family protein [Levilinea sp.]
MKKAVYQLMALLVVLALLAGCAPATAPVAEPAVPAEPAAPAEEPFRVALITPSTVNDFAFSQSIMEGLKVVQAQMGGPSMFEIALSESMFVVPDAAAAIRDYASQGFDLVIAHSSRYGTSLQQIAPEFPEVAFAWGNSLDTFQKAGVENVFAYQAEAQEGGYAMGVLAAHMTETGMIGVSGPVEAGDAKLYVDGFVAGVKNAGVPAEVAVSYTGSFSDVSLMAAAAETHTANGADVMTGSSQSVVGAIGVLRDKGGYWFGQQWDQTGLAPELVVASQVYDWSHILGDIVKSVRAGVMGGKSYTLTFNNEGLRIVFNPGIEVPAEGMAAFEAAIQGIKDGTIDPLTGPKQ